MSRSLRLGLSLALLTILAVGPVAGTAAGGRRVLDSTMTGLPIPNTVL